MLFFVFINDWPRLTKLKYFVFVQQCCYWFLLCCRHLYYLEQNLYFGVYLKVYFSQINKYAFLLPTHHLMKQACMFNVNLESGHPEFGVDGKYTFLMYITDRGLISVIIDT